MPFNIQSTLETIQMCGYLSCAMATTVAYDFVLIFSREVDYVWLREWTFVSTMFVLVRYAGITWALISGLSGCNVFPPSEMQFTVLHNIDASNVYLKGTALYLTAIWSFPLFLCAADLVMVLRVYAMWDRSKLILGILLCMYVLQVVGCIFYATIYNNPDTYLSATVLQLNGSSFCIITYKNIPHRLNFYNSIPRLVLGMTLLTLAITQTVKQSIEMHKATKQWQPNRYMQLLVSDGILYFLANVLFNIFFDFADVLADTSLFVMVMGLLGYISLCPIMPRFIIGIRELYEHSLHKRWRGIDTGFGVISRPGADVAPRAEEQEQVAEFDMVELEMVRSEALGDGTHQV